MATVTTSIGTDTNNVDISSVSGTGPYTVTLASMPGTAAIGDRLQDEAASQNDYLITGISGNDLTVTDVLGAGTAPSAAGSTQAVVKRCYSTLTLWEADLDDTTLYASTDDAVGECYNDSAFDEDVVINGGGTVGLASRTLRAATGHEHDGTADSGARISRGSGTGTILTVAVANTTVDLLEIDGGTSGSITGISPQAATVTISRCLVHDISHGAANHTIGIGSTTAADWRVLNCIVMNIDQTRNAGWTTFGITEGAGGAGQGKILNCTVFGVDNSGPGSGPAYGISCGVDSANKQIRNCIVCSTTVSAGTGSATDFNFPSASPSGTFDYNISEDASADDSGDTTNSLINKFSTPGSHFVSVTGGSEDLHLVSGSDAIDVGVDLGTTPTGVNDDIDGRDRDAEGDTWDMGAHEFVAAGGGAWPHNPLGHPIHGPFAGPIGP